MNLLLDNTNTSREWEKIWKNWTNTKHI